MKAGPQTPSSTGPGLWEGLIFLLAGSTGGLCGGGGGVGGFRDCRLHFTVEFVRPSFPHPRRSEKTARFLIKWFCVVPCSQSECLSIV